MGEPACPAEPNIERERGTKKEKKRDGTLYSLTKEKGDLEEEDHTQQNKKKKKEKKEKNIRRLFQR